MLKNILLLLSLCFLATASHSQRTKLLYTDSSLSLRGLSVVDNKTIWVSGTKGTVLKSNDGGRTWKRFTVKGYENIDFRDIEAFDANNAIIMGTGSPAFILKTSDGGASWQQKYVNKDPDIFLDALTFLDSQTGYALGDPIDDKFTLLVTNDAGETWEPLAPQEVADASVGEACFAASGTNIRKWKKNKIVYITGGSSAHMVKGTEKTILPLQQGTTSQGANSIAVKDSNVYIAVGGDFTRPHDSLLNCAITRDGGKNWRNPVKSPRGYRSCVEFIRNNTWITCGLTGVDITNDDGISWIPISKIPFHTVRKAKTGNAVYLSGPSGHIGVLVR